MMKRREGREERGAVGEMLDFLASNSPYAADETEKRGLWSPAADVYELEDRLYVVLEIAGMRSKDFQIRVEQGALLIRGERRAPHGGKEKRFHSLERHTGAFEKRIPIPEGFDRNRPKSRYLEGVLEVSFPVAVRSEKP
ncbi:MAG: Hsp20/alpha crystallin family protein [Candidatus Eisenbacteria bacterium]|nr:Hsp20/alpha crystallin family protein [Candidatus Eisenbacteria bacterium]